MKRKIKKGMRVRCPKMGGEWAKVSYVSPDGRVEIKYPGAGYVVEVGAEDVVFI